MNKVTALMGRTTTLNVGLPRGTGEATLSKTMISMANEGSRSPPLSAPINANPAMISVEARFGIGLPPRNANLTAMGRL